LEWRRETPSFLGKKEGVSPSQEKTNDLALNVLQALSAKWEIRILHSKSA